MNGRTHADVVKDRNAVFEYLQGFAKRGERAPTRDAIEKLFGSMSFVRVAELRHKGHMTIELYGRNWRVFRFKDGTHTQLPPHGGKPHLVLDSQGDHRPPT